MKGKITKLSLFERKESFQEVSQGFSQEEALKEAVRCLQCKDSPCNKGCPAGINIKAFIRLIREKKYTEAINKIKESNSLPGVCGRVCPQEEQCQLHCVLNSTSNPIQIGCLERFAADWEFKTNSTHPRFSVEEYKKESNPNKPKIAVIGTRSEEHTSELQSH